MQTKSREEQTIKLQVAFTQKYDEPIPMETLTELTEKYSDETVSRVITSMKPDAYDPISYLKKCLSSGWYQNDEKPKTDEQQDNNPTVVSDEAASTLRFTWNYRMERGWINKEERDYMLDVWLSGATRDEEHIQDINFRCLQGMYPDAPATWFYWLPQRERRAAANTWIVQSDREDLKLYEIS